MPRFQNKSVFQNIVPPDDDSRWKGFKRDTEAGRLLTRLYGYTSTNCNKIKYPILKKKAMVHCGEKAQHPDNWRAVNAKFGSSDPRQATFDKEKANSVAVSARHDRGSCIFSKAAPVDTIPRRKSEKACKENVGDNVMLRCCYRPPNQQTISTDEEKDRLSEIFASKGGRALPSNMTNPPLMPSEWKEKSEEQNRVERAKARRRARLQYGGMIDSSSTISSSSPQETLKGSNRSMMNPAESLMLEQIANEIKDRLHFQLSMEDLGAGTDSRQLVADEIAQRMRELERIDASRALEVRKGLR